MPIQENDVLRQPKLSDKAKYLITGLVLVFLLLIAVIVVLLIVNQRMNRADAYIKEGNQHYAMLDYDQAELCYKEAISLKETDADAYLSLAKTYLAKGDWESAVAILEYGYKKTEDAGIQTELERLRTAMGDDSDTVTTDSRSVLSADTMDVQTGWNANAYHIADGTGYAAPGTLVSVNPAVPYVDDGILEQFRTTEPPAETTAAPDTEKADNGENAAGGNASAEEGTKVSQTEPAAATETQPATVITTTIAPVTTVSATETETSDSVYATTTVPVYILTNEAGVSRTIYKGELEMWYRYWKHMVSSTTTAATTTGTSSGSLLSSMTTKTTVRTTTTTKRTTTSRTVSTGSGLSETTTETTTAATTTIGSPLIDPAAYSEFMEWLQLFIFDIFGE
ncbi:MAG: tetratricopeptide repeat protein [Ruminococcus sp.]|nr:tetratricopeptide repeat protein [Ruminococcus sp.]